MSWNSHLCMAVLWNDCTTAACCIIHPWKYAVEFCKFRSGKLLSFGVQLFVLLSALSTYMEVPAISCLLCNSFFDHLRTYTLEQFTWLFTVLKVLSWPASMSLWDSSLSVDILKSHFETFLLANYCTFESVWNHGMSANVIKIPVSALSCCGLFRKSPSKIHELH